jgi:hypothetical protein
VGLLPELRDGAMAADAGLAGIHPRLRLIGESSGLSRAVLPIVVVVGQAAFVLRSIFDDSGGNESAIISGVGVYSLQLLSAVFSVFVLVGLWGVLTRRGATQIAKNFSHAIVMVGNKSRVLDQAFVKLQPTDVESRGKRLPGAIIVVADQSGIKWYRGWVHPIVFFETTWDVVSGVEVVRIADGGRVGRGLAVAIVSGEVIHELPVIILGKGPCGVFTLDVEKLSAIALQLTIWIKSSREIVTLEPL